MNKVNIRYKVNADQTIQFVSDEKLIAGKKLIIDPYITTTSSLTGITASVSNMGFDVDYDAQGNLLVLGGGGGVNNGSNAPKIAKYDINGNLVWTFIGVLAAPAWANIFFKSSFHSVLP